MNIKKQRANTFDTGVAAEYFVLSQLYRLGLEAYISQGNKKAIDIRIIKNNKTTVSLDVKAVRGYSSLVVNNFKPQDKHFAVFIIYNNKFDNLNILPDVYIVPSRKVAQITTTYGSEKRIMKGDLKDYLNQWELLTI